MDAWHAFILGWHPANRPTGLVSTWTYRRETPGETPETRLIVVSDDGVFLDGQPIKPDEELSLWLMRTTVELADDGWTLLEHRTWNETPPPP